MYNTIEWSNVDQDHVVPYGWDWDSVSQCKEQSVTNQMGAFTTAATLLFAMNGCLTRIRTVADSNFQSTAPTFEVRNPFDSSRTRPSITSHDISLPPLSAHRIPSHHHPHIHTPTRKQSYSGASRIL